MSAYKIAAYVPVSREMIADAKAAAPDWRWIAEELRESLLWAAAGRERPSRWNVSPFAAYSPRLWGWWRDGLSARLKEAA